MKAYINEKDELREIELSRKDVETIQRKDYINIDSISYLVLSKSLFFDKDNRLDYVTIDVERI